MPDLFRVVTWRVGARKGEPGHPAHVLAAAQGRGRIDNPGLYTVSYLSGDPAGAVAERFGAFDPWRPATFTVRGLGEGARFALVRFRLEDAVVLDLDDPRVLTDRDLRPSQIVTTERKVTQRWARTIFEDGSWAGVSWWSRYDARWTSYGVWEPTHLAIVGQPVPIDLGHEAVLEAAEILSRPTLAA